MVSQSDLKILWEGISKHAPILSQFFDYKKTLLEHSAYMNENNADPVYCERQLVIVETIKKELKRLYKIDKVSIKPPLTINIVDHHAIITHPILVATNIVSNAYQLLMAGSKEPAVVFSSGIVPPNNFLNKKGVHLHGKQISLFSNKEIHQAGYLIPKHDFHFVEKFKKNKQWQVFTVQEQSFLENFEKKICGLPMDHARDYADQVGLINEWLWPKLFAPELRDSLPSLNYIPGEEIIRLNIEHVVSEETFIHKALFDANLRTFILNEFNGISGCWSSDGEKGTHFFWYCDENNMPVALRLSGNGVLETQDQKIQLEFEKENIIQLVKEKKIIPSLFIIYSWIIFWSGVKPLSGYGSGTYLTKMKNAWLRVLEKHDEAEYARLTTIDTKCLIGGEMVTYKRGKGTLEPQYALDVMYDGGLSRSYLEQLTQMNFSKLVMPCLPDVYGSYVPASERKPLSIKPEDMMDSSFDWVA